MYLAYLKGSQYFPKIIDRELVRELVFLNAIIGLEKWKNCNKGKEDFLGNLPVTRSYTRAHITF